MTKLTPLVKGIITGLCMVIVTLALFLSHVSPDSPLNYINYIVFALGIMWTLIPYSKSENFTGKFGELFGQGFKCFIVVVLIMVAFSAIFTITHPEFAEEASQQYGQDLKKENKNRNAKEIEELVAKAKNGYTTAIISATIFGTLVTGAFITAAGSAFILMRRK